MHTARDLKTSSSKDFKECPAMFLSRSELVLGEGSRFNEKMGDENSFSLMSL